MKKRFLGPLLLALTLACPLPAAAALQVSIDGHTLETDVPPVIDEGRTLLPVRAILEALGATVDWDAANQVVMAATPTDQITLTVGSTTATVNGHAKTLDVPAQIREGRTLIPARFVAEALGCAVDWAPETQTVTITTPQDLAGPYSVVRVVDGDTFVIDRNGTEEKVRLIGVDTPESVHPDAAKNTDAGKSASEHTQELLTGKSVYLEFDVQERDKYGRLLAYVYLDGEMLNERLLEEGYAVLATYPPNVKYLDRLQETAGIAAPTEAELSQAAYIGNASSHKLHRPDCSGVASMSPQNKVVFNTLAEALAAGYEPCGICQPQ